MDYLRMAEHTVVVATYTCLRYASTCGVEPAKENTISVYIHVCVCVC